MKTFAICHGTPFERSTIYRTVKIIPHYFFLKMSKFFAKLRLLVLMMSCEKLILIAALIFPDIRTTIVIFNFTLAFFIVLHAAFF